MLRQPCNILTICSHVHRQDSVWNLPEKVHLRSIHLGMAVSHLPILGGCILRFPVAERFRLVSRCCAEPKAAGLPAEKPTCSRFRRGGCLVFARMAIR